MLSISGGKHKSSKHSEDDQSGGKSLIVLTSNTICSLGEMFTIVKLNTISKTPTGSDT